MQFPQSRTRLSTHAHTLFKMLYPHRPLQSIKESSLCYTCVHSKSLQLCLTLCSPTNCISLFCPRNFLGKNTAVGCHSLLQGIFPDSGFEPMYLASPALAGTFFTMVLPGKPHFIYSSVYEYSCLENPMDGGAWLGRSPGGLRSMESLRVGHYWATSLSLFAFMHWRRKWQSTPVFLPGESQGRGSLVGFRLWGRTESDTTEVT